MPFSGLDHFELAVNNVDFFDGRNRLLSEQCLGCGLHRLPWVRARRKLESIFARLLNVQAFLT